MRSILLYPAALCLALGCGLPAQASILTFEIFDPGFVEFDEFGDPIVANFNNPAVQPFLSEFYGYPEGFRIDGYLSDAGTNFYGSRVTATSVAADGGVVFQYGVDSEGFTPNVRAFYGPYSIFTGAPTLWREGYSDLNGVLRQSSGYADPQNPIGTDYNILDIVLVADAGYDVQLYGFDLGSASFFAGPGGVDRTVGAVTAYSGVPFPFLTPTNTLPGLPINDVDVQGDLGDPHTSIDFSADPLTSPVIWLRIDMNKLGPDSEGIAIDNIRFGQIESNNEGTLDPEQIDAAFVRAETVPEPASVVLWLMGGALGGTFYRRKSHLAAKSVA
ncbi:MAG: PEP-CTERM sorting domain-containing protein [Planctomycetaceae bacterium]